MKTIIALNNIALGALSYQEVISIIEDKPYLSNVNIVLGSKTLKKIRFAEKELIYKKGMGKQIVMDYIEQMFAEDRKRASVKKRKKSRTNKKTVNKAAVDLMNEMGL